jgi:hypothetical protein
LCRDSHALGLVWRNIFAEFIGFLCDGIRIIPHYEARAGFEVSLNTFTGLRE